MDEKNEKVKHLHTLNGRKNGYLLHHFNLRENQAR